MRRFIALLLVLFISVSFVACTTDLKDSTNTTKDPILQAQEKLVEAYNLYSEDMPKGWITLASDEMSITVEKQGTYAVSPSLFTSRNNGIKNINKHLGFSLALWDKMDATVETDGMLKQTSEEYTVSWRFVKNKGLVVIYEVNP